ncbi:MAG: LptF/LptG family permease [Nitrospirae bacterium]|nr:LptF/LptG family permease [Nitrospirota bacterium]
MKIIHKSILKELIFTFILSLASLNFILMMEKLLKLSRLLSGIGTSILDMVRIIFYIQPQLFLLTIPMALLLSTLLVYGRLNFDNEIIILRNSGMNFLDISRAVVLLGTLCFFLNMAVSFYLGPKSSIKLREEITNIIKARTPLAIEEGRFNSSFKDTTIYIKERVSDKTVRGIFIYDNRDKKEPRVLIAKEGEIYTEKDFDINFYLKDGYINIVKGNRTTELFFKKYNMVLRLESDSFSGKKAELTPFEIIQKIKKEDIRNALSLYLELHRRVSLPLLCIILIFFGPPLALIAGKSGRLGGLTLGLAVFTLYYMLLLYGENLVKAGKIIHYIGAWSPSVILGVLAFLIFKKEYSK